MLVECPDPGTALQRFPRRSDLLPAFIVPPLAGTVVTAWPKDDLRFPNVDSCLAIAFILNDRRIVAGHVVQGAFKAWENAEKTAKQMRTISGGATIKKVVVVGDPGWINGSYTPGKDGTAVQKVLEISGCDNYLVLTKPMKPVDVGLNRAGQKVDIKGKSWLFSSIDGPTFDDVES